MYKQYTDQQKVDYCWEKLQIAINERDIKRARQFCAILNNFYRKDKSLLLRRIEY